MGQKGPFFPTSLTPRNKSAEKNRFFFSPAGFTNPKKCKFALS